MDTRYITFFYQYYRSPHSYTFRKSSPIYDACVTLEYLSVHNLPKAYIMHCRIGVEYPDAEYLYNPAKRT